MSHWMLEEFDQWPRTSGGNLIDNYHTENNVLKVV